MTDNNSKETKTTPTYYAWSVVNTKDKSDSRWTRLGAFFPHKDGQGGTLVLDALPIQFDGRIVLRVPTQKSE